MKTMLRLLRAAPLALIMILSCSSGDETTAADSECVLSSASRIVATRDGQVVENLHVKSTSGPGILVDGKRNVVIRNVLVEHAGGPGILFRDAPGLQIENVHVIHTGAPEQGANPDPELNNIHGYGSTDVGIENVKLERGSSGVYLDRCPGAAIRRIEGHDFRGPFPRGQLVQFNNCDGASLEDFSAENPPSSSWVEDNVSVYQSSDVVVRRGLVDGNNSPSGVGIMFEQDAGTSRGGLCEDVDAVRMGNGCFSAYPGRGVTFVRTRCRDNICGDQGRGVPLSSGLAWAGSPASQSLQILDSAYDDLCGGLVWDRDVFDRIVLVEQDFELRQPQRISFCWE